MSFYFHNYLFITIALQTLSETLGLRQRSIPVHCSQCLTSHPHIEVPYALPHRENRFLIINKVFEKRWHEIVGIKGSNHHSLSTPPPTQIMNREGCGRLSNGPENSNP